MSFLRNRLNVALAGSLALLAPFSVAAQTTSPAEPAALSQMAAALGTAIKADPWFEGAVYDFYAARGFAPFWMADAETAAKLAAVVNSAAAHALPRDHYKYGGVFASPADPAAAELQAMRAFLTFAGDVAAGVLQPRTLDREIHLFPDRPAHDQLLAALVRLGDPQAVVAEVQPFHKQYERGRALLSNLTDIVDQGDWGPGVADGGTLKLGSVGPRVAALRARLIAMGDLPPSEGQETGVVIDSFDETLEFAVIAFQRRHGLNADGAAGRRTIAAVNVSAAQRRDQAVAAMERMRWMNKDLGAEHIYVNLADFRVNVIKNGAVVFDERVVVGKSRKHRTPEFSDMMSHLVLNPTWNIPRSIATKEILPELQANPNYLAERNMELVGVNGSVPPEPLLADWSLYDQSSFPFRIKQHPGAGNALGRVKFMFPNQFAIYLHDTPSKRLFAKDARAFSHGCVRVQDPLELARVLLDSKYDDPASTIDRILDKGSEAYVNLAAPMPVHLTYRTAWVDDAGVMQFRADVYGRDALIRSALGELGVTGRPAS